MADIRIDPAEHLEAIRARESSASPGPWTFSAFEASSEPLAFVSDARRLTIASLNGPQAAADADFMSHARSDIPVMLAQIAALTADRAALTELALTAMNLIGWEPEDGEMDGWDEKFAQHRAPEPTEES